MKNMNINRLSNEKKKQIEEKLKNITNSNSSKNLTKMQLPKDKERLHTAREGTYRPESIPLTARGSRDSQKSSFTSKSPDRPKTAKESKRLSDISIHKNYKDAKEPVKHTILKEKENISSKQNKEEVVDYVNRKCQLLHDKLTYLTKIMNDINKDVSSLKVSYSNPHSMVSDRKDNSNNNSFANEKSDKSMGILEQKVSYLYSKCNKLYKDLESISSTVTKVESILNHDKIQNLLSFSDSFIGKLDKLPEISQRLSLLEDKYDNIQRNMSHVNFNQPTNSNFTSNVVNEDEKEYDYNSKDKNSFKKSYNSFDSKNNLSIAKQSNVEVPTKDEFEFDSNINNDELFTNTEYINNISEYTRANEEKNFSKDGFNELDYQIIRDAFEVVSNDMDSESRNGELNEQGQVNLDFSTKDIDLEVTIGPDSDGKPVDFNQRQVIGHGYDMLEIIERNDRQWDKANQMREALGGGTSKTGTTDYIQKKKMEADLKIDFDSSPTDPIYGNYTRDSHDQGQVTTLNLENIYSAKSNEQLEADEYKELNNVLNLYKMKLKEMIGQMLAYLQTHKSALKEAKVLAAFRHLHSDYVNLKSEYYESVNKICDSDKELKEAFEIWYLEYESNREHLDNLHDAFNRVGKDESESLVNYIKNYVNTQDFLNNNSDL